MDEHYLIYIKQKPCHSDEWHGLLYTLVCDLPTVGANTFFVFIEFIYEKAVNKRRGIDRKDPY